MSINFSNVLGSGIKMLNLEKKMNNPLCDSVGTN